MKSTRINIKIETQRGGKPKVEMPIPNLQDKVMMADQHLNTGVQREEIIKLLLLFGNSRRRSTTENRVQEDTANEASNIVPRPPPVKFERRRTSNTRIPPPINLVKDENELSSQTVPDNDFDQTFVKLLEPISFELDPSAGQSQGADAVLNLTISFPLND